MIASATPITTKLVNIKSIRAIDPASLWAESAIAATEAGRDESGDPDGLEVLREHMAEGECGERVLDENDRHVKLCNARGVAVRHGETCGRASSVWGAE